MEKILITGATGLLGTCLAPLLLEKRYKVITHGFMSKADVNFDLRNLSITWKHLDRINPDVIVNLAALTNVDQCEKHCNDAYLINVKTIENIAAWIQQQPSCFLVHVSTDQVYDGKGPHGELDVTLTNYYAFSKYLSEVVASKVESTVLRTNFFGKSNVPGKKSLSDWAIDSLQCGDHIKLFTDIFFSPLYIQSICAIIEVAIKQKKTGIFNVGSNKGMSKCDFILSIAAKCGLSIDNTERVESKQFHFKAYRPKDMRMDNSLFEKTFAVSLPTFADEIRKLS